MAKSSNTNTFGHLKMAKCANNFAPQMFSHDTAMPCINMQGEFPPQEWVWSDGRYATYHFSMPKHMQHLFAFKFYILEGIFAQQLDLIPA